MEHSSFSPAFAENFHGEQYFFDFDDLAFLTVPLPDDLAALKSAGRFAELRRKIGERLAQGWVENAMRRRLVLELRILERMEIDYTLTRAQLLAALDALLRDFDPAELDAYEAAGLTDWILIEGEQRFLGNTVDNLLTVDLKLTPRRRTWPEEQRAHTEEAEKDEMRHIMEQTGSLAMRYHIRCTVKLRPQDERPGHLLRVQLPLPVEYAQVENFRLLGTSHPPVLVAPPQQAQRTVLMEKVLEAGDTFWVEYQYDCCNRYLPLYALADGNEGGAVNAAKPLSPAEQSLWLAETAPHIVFTPYLRALAQRIVGQESAPLRKARAIYDWITHNIRYSFARSYFAMPDIAEYTARNQRGDCGMETLLFITLCRICGVPARWQAGRSMTPCDGGTYCHDWAQFYVAPYGWVFADCSYGVGAVRTQDEEKRRFFFGNLTPARIPLAADFQQRLAVPMHYLRFDPYDNQVGEAEYIDAGLPYGAVLSDTVSLSAEKL